MGPLSRFIGSKRYGEEKISEAVMSSDKELKDVYSLDITTSLSLLY